MATLAGTDLSGILGAIQQGVGDLLSSFKPETNNPALGGLGAVQQAPDLWAGLSYNTNPTAYQVPTADPLSYGSGVGFGVGSGPDLFGDFQAAKGRADQAAQEQQARQAATATAFGGGDMGSAQWAGIINEEAGKYADAPELAEVAQAVMELESGGRADAQGVVVTQGPYAGQRAQGLMQIMPGNYPGVNLLDPRTNVQKGLEMLYERYKRYGNWDSAVASYFGAVDANGNPTSQADDNGTTGVQYVAIVNGHRQRIKQGATRQPGSAPVTAQGAAFPVVGFTGQVQLHHGAHQGAADLFAPAGTAVAAMTNGQVTSAGWSDIGGWNVTIYDPTSGLTFYYAHLQNAPMVQAGQTIAAGSVFGQVGDTGNAKGTGAHLHLGIGYGIQNGTGPAGGAGINFNATAYLQQVLGLTAQQHYPGDGHGH